MREGANWPDLLIALAAVALTTGIVIFATSFVGENVLGGEAGRFWARAFAGALALTGLFLALLAVGLLGERSRERGHYGAPLATGVSVGAIEGALLLDGASREALLAPLLLLPLALPPVRRALARLAGRRPHGGTHRR